MMSLWNEGEKTNPTRLVQPFDDGSSGNSSDFWSFCPIHQVILYDNTSKPAHQNTFFLQKKAVYNTMTINSVAHVI